MILSVEFIRLPPPPLNLSRIFTGGFTRMEEDQMCSKYALAQTPKFLSGLQNHTVLPYKIIPQKNRDNKRKS